jgi:TP901 family phage tail tape measure protein
MALTQYGMGFLFQAKDLASPVIQRIGGAADAASQRAQALQSRFFQAGKTMAKGTAMMGIGLKALGGLGKTVKEYAGFQSVVASAAAIAGASTEGYNKLYKAAQRAGIETMFSPRQAALGLRVLSQAGLNVQDSIKALIPSLNLATASFGELTPEQTAGLVVVAMKTFGVQADNVKDAVGRMVHAANTAKMSIGDLQLGLAGASRGSLALKQSLSETLISLGLIKNAGFRTQRAATQLSMAMARIADPKAQKKLAEMNITVADSTGKFRPFLDVIRDVTSATANMTDKKRAAYLQDVFGMEAMGGLMAIMNQLTKGIKSSTGETLTGAAAINHLRKGMQAAGGTADMMSRKYLTTMEGQFKLMKGSLDTLKIAVGGLFVKTFLPAVQTVTKALNAAIGAVERMPGPVKDLIGTLAPIAASALVVGGLVKAFRGLVGMMAAAKAAALGMGAATTGATASAGNAMVAFGGFGGAINQATAQNLALARSGKQGDLMLLEMRKAGLGATRTAGRLARALGGLGKAFSALPLVGVAYGLGQWIAKSIASHSWIQKEINALKKYNKQLDIRITLTKDTITATRKMIDLSKSEHTGIVKIAEGIKTRKDAEIAMNRVKSIMAKQTDVIIEAEKRVADAKEKAAVTGKEQDRAAVKRAVNRFEIEKKRFEAMARSRELVVAKLTSFEAKKFRIGSAQRFEAEISMAYGAWHEQERLHKERKKREWEYVMAVKEGAPAVIKLRRAALEQAESLENKAWETRKKRVRQAIRAGVATGVISEAEARQFIVSELGRRAKGAVAPVQAMRERVGEGASRARRGPEVGGMTAWAREPAETERWFAAEYRDLINAYNKAMVMLGKRPIVVNVAVGGKSVSKTVSDEKTEETESRGGITTTRRAQGAG